MFSLSVLISHGLQIRHFRRHQDCIKPETWGRECDRLNDGVTRVSSSCLLGRLAAEKTYPGGLGNVMFTSLGSFFHLSPSVFVLQPPLVLSLNLSVTFCFSFLLYLSMCVSGDQLQRSSQCWPVLFSYTPITWSPVDRRQCHQSMFAPVDW